MEQKVLWLFLFNAILNTSLRVKRLAVGGECLFLFILLFCLCFFLFTAREVSWCRSLRCSPKQW